MIRFLGEPWKKETETEMQLKHMSQMNVSLIETFFL